MNVTIQIPEQAQLLFKHLEVGDVFKLKNDHVSTFVKCDEFSCKSIGGKGPVFRQQADFAVMVAKEVNIQF